MRLWQIESSCIFDLLDPIRHARIDRSDQQRQRGALEGRRIGFERRDDLIEEAALREHPIRWGRDAIKADDAIRHLRLMKQLTARRADSSGTCSDANRMV